jgi:hypothetical protein
MSGDAKGSGVTVPASLTSTTSLTSPIVNATTSLNTKDINATTLTLGKTTITEDQLFDLLNTQTDYGCGNCDCTYGPRDIIFKIPFRKVPIVYISLSGTQTGSGGWVASYVGPIKVSTTGFTYNGWTHGYTNIRWVAMASNYNWLVSSDNAKKGCGEGTL